MPDWVVAVLSV